MARTRARERSLISVMLASLLLIGTLAGCDSVESQRVAFEKQGYSNVQNLKNEGRPNSYRATLNSCTIELFLTQDKELWTAHISETAIGSTAKLPHPPGDTVFMPAGNAKELQENQRFIKYCP